MHILRRLCRISVSYLLALIGLPILLTHPKIRSGVAARLGFHPPACRRPRKSPRVWFHGASAGDILALTPTARDLRVLQPSAQLIATTVTNSGRVMCDRFTDLFDCVTYLPYDLPGPVQRTLRQLQPELLVLEYTELWPQLIESAQRRGVRLVLHNGRLSHARMRQYRLLFALTGNLLAAFDLLLMRDDHEADRALALGAPSDRVLVTGNTKFDNLGSPPPAENVAALRHAAGLADDALVWVAGSTHEGEEEQILEVFAALRRKHSLLHLLVAPRYVERAEKIVTMATRLGFSARLRSRAGANVDVLVLDSMGELATCYALADVVFVGGSFVRRGGQNILEPAGCGRPVLFGPHTANVADSVQVLLGRGGIQVSGPAQLHRVLADLLVNRDFRLLLGEIAHHQVSAVRGASRRNAELIAGLLSSSMKPRFLT